jgi:hypothetical protein
MNSREGNVAALTSPTGQPTKGYAGTAKVTQLGLDGVPVKTYVFIDVFPTNLAPIPLDWQNDAMIEDYTVEFQYQYWVPGEEYAGTVVRRTSGL